MNKATLVPLVIGLLLIVCLSLLASTEETEQVGAALTITAGAALLIAFCAERLDDKTVDLAMARQRAKAVEGIAVAVALPASVMASGAELPWWSSILGLGVCTMLGVLFAGTRR